jgi:dolichol-phosphate mannosyltransferase
MPKLISIVVPVFRNEGSLILTHQKLVNLFESKLINYGYEIIFVNDGSDDGSWNELLQLKKHDEKVKLIDFSRNFGQVAAIVAGCRKSKGDMVIMMSADLQDPVELILQMVDSCEKSNDIVICTRVQRNDELMSKITSAIFYKLMKWANPNIPKGGFDFVLMSRKAVDQFNLIDERNRFLQGDIMWLGFSVVFIPYERLRRETGKSQWSFSKKLKYFVDGMINTSYLPLRMMSILGFVFAALGFLYALVVFYERLINNVPFKGYAVIVILLLSIGGTIMIMLGIVGAYLWRIFDESKKRNFFIIKNEIN